MLLGLAVLGSGPWILIFLPGVMVIIPAFCLMVAINNSRAERGVRRGGRRSVAWSYPRSGGVLGMWPAVLTDRRLVVVGTTRGGRMDVCLVAPADRAYRCLGSGEGAPVLGPDNTLALRRRLLDPSYRSGCAVISKRAWLMVAKP